MIEKESQIERLKKDIEENNKLLQEKFSNQDSITNELKHQLDEKQKENSILENQLLKEKESNKSIIDNKDKDIKELQLQLSKIQEGSDTLNTSINSLKMIIQEKESIISNLNKIIASKDNEFEKKEKTINDLQGIIDNIQCRRRCPECCRCSPRLP